MHATSQKNARHFTESYKDPGRPYKSCAYFMLMSFTVTIR